jgi:hypothetical protein
MPGIIWIQPETLWLNLANLSLAIVVQVCCVALVWGLLLDIRDRARRRRAIAGLDREVRRMFEAEGERHAFHDPHNGVTMADGGEPDKPPASRKSKPGQRS